MSRAWQTCIVAPFLSQAGQELTGHVNIRRCPLEIVHPQMTKPNGGTVTGGGEDVADLHVTVGDHDAVNQAFDERPPLLEGRLVQSVADLGTKRLKRLGD
jgi:hypothetical protein